ncbi:MAG: ferredoxin--nitrite reductase [Leptolyngbyaceae cyanobacterium MO_188.B28]|nr:ferredoxin--nitrite reductase [Leptolyngbyaceae cyanobacterium MO_188.B28]
MTNLVVDQKPKLNKFEKFKAEKDGLLVKDELEQFARIGWEAVDETDLKQRLKWLGIFFRPVTPGKFMLRLRTPSGVLSGLKMRVLAEIVQRYGDDGSADITTRQNLQLRGVRLEDIPDIFSRLHEAGMTSMQSGMDNVRNITGSPISGIDADELIDTQGLVRKVQDMITGSGEGNIAFTNLPRKFNIAIEGGRDNSVHAEINDIAFVPAYKDGQLGFNVLVGGFFSAKRCAAAVPLNAWVPPTNDVVDLCEAILTVYRDHGLRSNRQKARMMWLIDEWGMDKFRSAVEAQWGRKLATAAPEDEIDWDKRDHIGVYSQKQPGLNFVGLHVPVGRLQAQDMFNLARIAEVYGSGEIRLTVEQNAIIPNIPDSRLDTFLKEPLLNRFTINPTPLTRALVSCTGAQFCNFALVETKQRALALARELDNELETPNPVRIHWTGCPNSCGQPQVADIGLMGTKTRKDGKTVEAVDIYMGGKVGKNAQLGECLRKAVPCDDLKSVLRDLLVEHFDAQPLSEPRVSPEALTITPDQNSNRLVSANGKPDGAVATPPPTVSSTVTVTPTAPAPPPEPTPPAQAAVVHFAKTGKEVSCDDSESILTIAEEAGVEIDSSCQSGSCGTCKHKLLEGEFHYEADPDGLEDGDQEAGFVLTCIAHPVGRVVVDA